MRWIVIFLCIVFWTAGSAFALSKTGYLGPPGGFLIYFGTGLAYTSGVEEKFPKENFRVNREMRDEILVYESILTKF